MCHRFRGIRTLVLICLSWPLLAWGAARMLIVRSDAEHADALLVLSGGAPVYLERVAYAGHLVGAGRSARVLLTNDGVEGPWSSKFQRTLTSIESAAIELARAGVAPECIEIIPGLVSSTYDEAGVTRQYVKMHNIRSLLIVTSPYHALRAQWIFRRVIGRDGIRVGIVPTTHGAGTPSAASWWWHSLGWQMVAGEYVKLGYYWLRYR